MSHLTKVKSKIKNLNMLKQSLNEIKMKFVESNIHNKLKIKAWNKKNEDILLEIKTGCSYSVGVVLNEENNTYEFVADWWGVETYTGIIKEDFVNKITQKYAYNNVMDKIKDKGYELVTEEIDENKNIRIVLRRWE